MHSEGPTSDHYHSRGVEVEQHVLGALLSDNEQWAKIPPLKSEDFVSLDHRLIFETIHSLLSNGTPADVLTVSEHLKRGNQLDAAGGLAYLGRLARETALPSNAPQYAKILVSDALKRALADLGRALADPDGTPDEKLAHAETALRGIKGRRENRAPESLGLLRGSHVRMEAVDWLWHEWLICRALQVFAGPAGLGKTTIALSLAARVTSGGLWPDGSPCTKQGSVVFWSGEDDVATTLMPRFVAAGGDPDRIYFVDSVIVNGHGERITREFDPSKDMPLLIEAAAKIHDVRLFIVDPVSMCVGGDSNKNAEVRRGLAPLKTFAERHGAATLGISHFSKGSEGRDPLSRVTGSLAFGAAPRLVLSAVTETKKPDEPEDAEPRHLFIRTKSNNGPAGDGFRYTVEQVAIPDGITGSRIIWGEHIKGAARDLLADAERVEDAEERSAQDDAAEFLKEVLEGGPLESKSISADARQAGHSQRTIERAKAALRVHAFREGTPPRWFWRLPEQGRQPGDQPRQSQNVGGLGGLGGLNDLSSTYHGHYPPEYAKAANAANGREGKLNGGLEADRETF